MQLTVWTYEAPPHVGAMRVATAMEGVHYVLHAPQGDTYADLLFTMIERRAKRPPVTYTTFQARDLGGDTAELFKNAEALGDRLDYKASETTRTPLELVQECATMPAMLAGTIRTRRFPEGMDEGPTDAPPADLAACRAAY